MDSQVFSIAPPAGRAMWFMLAIPGLALALGFALLLPSLLGSRSARFEVSSAGLRLQGDWYGRLIPAEQVKWADVTRVNLAQSSNLEPRRRTLGTGLPGYRAGWFRLRNGERALLYLTDLDRAVHVPTTAGYSVIVSPADPDAFVAAAHRVQRSG